MFKVYGGHKINNVFSELRVSKIHTEYQECNKFGGQIPGKTENKFKNYNFKAINDNRNNCCYLMLV